MANSNQLKRKYDETSSDETSSNGGGNNPDGSVLPPLASANIPAAVENQLYNAAKGGCGKIRNSELNRKMRESLDDYKAGCYQK